MTAPAFPTRELLTAFDQAHRRKFHQPYRVLKGKDPKLAHDLLVTYTLPDLERWVEAFFISRDAFICASTYSFGVFAACVGKLISADAKARPAAPKPAPAHSQAWLDAQRELHGDPTK